MQPDLARLLEGYHAVVTLPVQWGEQDAFQHVNHAVYFRWFESARIAYWGKAGLSTLMKHQRIGPILASVSCDYRRQITYPDTVHVGMRVSRIGRTSLQMDGVVVQAEGRALAAESRSTIVVFDYQSGMPVPVPLEIREAMEAIEGRSLSS
jgi:acyl-CoA thioester hydrolase